MYAIESKKRKFDRALESISQRSLPASASKTSLHSVGQKESRRSIDVTEKPDPKKRVRLSDEGVKKDLVQKNSTTNLPGQPNYLPHSQAAFLARLSTFSSIHNWRISSSEPINAVEWARRGWVCAGRERIACRGGCGTELLVRIEDDGGKSPDKDADADEEEDAIRLADERHNLLVQKYKQLIIESHLDHCPWKKRGCDISIQRLPLLNAHSSVRDLQTRYDGIMENEKDLPSNIRLGTDEEVDQHALTSKLRCDADIFPDSSKTKWTRRNGRAFTLALCGWEPAADLGDSDIIECRSCFRRLGLWLYRPKSPEAEPTMEHLDAIDTHLDYCPWKSTQAQQTQIEMDGQKKSYSGWELLASNVEKEQSRISSNRRKQKNGQADGAIDNDDAVSVISQMTTTSQKTTPEEKERRAKALMKKIRELKKPFNVKSLLKRKEATK